MTRYIATFYTHFAAVSTYRAMTEAGIPSRLAPVPRALSADCGACLYYQADAPRGELLHRDFDRVVREDTKETVLRNDSAV